MAKLDHTLLQIYRLLLEKEKFCVIASKTFSDNRGAFQASLRQVLSIFRFNNRRLQTTVAVFLPHLAAEIGRETVDFAQEYWGCFAA